MSNRTENLALSARNRRAGSDSGVPVPNYNDRNWPHSMTQPVVHQPDEGRGVPDPHRLFEERVRTGPFGLTRYPSQLHSPIQILILDGGTAEVVNPRLQQFSGDSPPRIMSPWQMGFTPHQEEPGLTEEEFKRSMSKLRKHVFSPPYPRKRAYKRGLFSPISASHSNNADEDEEDDKGRECAICLDEFVPSQQVLLTPCNHMFHKECIATWVKGHGQCPVCRFVFAEKRRENTVRRNNNNHNNNHNNNRNNRNETMELIALMRTVGEVFDSLDIRHH